MSIRTTLQHRQKSTTRQIREKRAARDPREDAKLQRANREVREIFRQMDEPR
jgi:hypothetical protein